jgi:hypothetical protein
MSDKGSSFQLPAIPSHFNNNLIPAHAIAHAAQVPSPRHRLTYHHDGLCSHSFITPPSFPTLTPSSVSSWIDNTQTTRSTTAAGHGPTTRLLLRPRHYRPCTARTCPPDQNQPRLLRRAGLQCDDTARGEATLELALSNDQYLTTAQVAATIFAILPPLLLMNDSALGRTVLTSAAAVTSASRLSADEPWRTDAL